MISEGLLICLVGRGSIGACHLRNLNSLGQKNIIAYSENSNKEKDEEYINTYGVKTFNSIEGIKCSNPYAFIIANPTSKHIETAQLAIAMNSHIFMEKPVSNGLKGIDELREKIHKKKLTFFLANNFRFHPVIIKLKELIEKNEFGDIYFARIMAGQYLPDWHPWEDYRQGYSARKDLGGGVVLTLQHEIDYAYWLFGEFKGIKSKVKKMSQLETDVEDIASIILETKTDHLVEIHLDYLQRPPKRTIHIQGSKGSIDYKFGDEYLQFYNFNKQTYDNILDLSNYDNNQMYLDEMKHFIECINNNEKPRSNIDDAIYVLETCLEIKKEFQYG